MPLPTLTWRNVGRASFSPGSVTALLDALYTLGTSSTYNDGSSRTPGTGAAGTWVRYQNGATTEAVYCTPSVSALNARVIFAGVQSGSPTPPMAFSESFLAATLLAGVAKNAGSFNAWDAASPFTSGEFSGYCPAWGNAASSGFIDLFESQEAVYIVLGLSGSNTRHICGGAYIDPGSTNNADAESDGRLYGMYTTGNNQALVNMVGAITTNAWMVHSNSVTRGKNFVFEPGGSALQPLERNVLNNTITSFIGRLPSGKYLQSVSKIPLIYITSPDYLAGTLRDMAFFGQGSQGQQLVHDGTVIGNIVSEWSIPENESVILLRNA